MMVTPTLTLPEEPRALKSMARTLLDQAPETGLPLVVGRRVDRRSALGVLG